MTTVNRIEIPIPFPLKWVNCYYIQGSVPTLIDTGIHTEEGFLALDSAIKKGGGSLTDMQESHYRFCHKQKAVDQQKYGIKHHFQVRQGCPFCCPVEEGLIP